MDCMPIYMITCTGEPVARKRGGVVRTTVFMQRFANPKFAVTGLYITLQIFLYIFHSISNNLKTKQTMRR